MSAKPAPTQLDAIADFVAGLEWSGMPAEVQQRMQVALLDTLGCLLAGSAMPAAKAAKAAKALAGDGVVMQAHYLGVVASALDFDDGHYQGGGIHPGAAILPALLALASPDVGGERLLACLAAGYEVAIRAGWLLAPRTAGDRYHTSGAAGCLGAAAAAAKLVGLDARGVSMALRTASAYMPMATLQVPGVKESIGWGAATAVAAVRLAQAGFAGMGHAPMHAPLGIAATPFDDERAGECFVASVGRQWHSTAAYLKPYACCRAFHAALDGIAAILDEAGRIGAEVEAVEVTVMAAVSSLNYLPVPSPEHAQFSLPYAIGCLLANGDVGARRLLPAALGDPAVLGLARRVTLIADPTMVPLAAHTSYPAEVAVTVGGQRLRRRVEHALGSAARPLGADRVAGKFFDNAGLALGPAQAQQLLDYSLGAASAWRAGDVLALLSSCCEASK